MLTALLRRGIVSVHFLLLWISLPFSRGGRIVLSWIFSAGIYQTAMQTKSLPQLTWSQDGEDLLFSELFPPTGTYVDVGAHHPDRFSVTKLLYDRGWRGINIDSSPNFMELFMKRRPGDINIDTLVGKPRNEYFYEFSEPALNTLNSARAEQLVRLGWKQVRQRSVTVQDLNFLMEKHLPLGAHIDLLSIDVEGEELSLLSTLNWNNWSIQRCLVEIVEPAFRVSNHPVAKLIMSQGLELTRVWGRSCLFERDFQSDELDRTVV